MIPPTCPHPVRCEVSECNGACRKLTTTPRPIALAPIDGAALRRRRASWFREGIGWLLGSAAAEVAPPLHAAFLPAPIPAPAPEPAAMNPTTTPEPEHGSSPIAALMHEPAMSFQPAPAPRPPSPPPAAELKIGRVRGGFILIASGELFAVTSDPAALGALAAEWAGSA